MQMDIIQNKALPAWHPVINYQLEAALISKLLSELDTVACSSEPQKFFNIFNQLNSIEIRFVRKENQLFPFLEKKGWDGPSKSMWSFHDTLRQELRLTRKQYDAHEYDALDRDFKFLKNSILTLLRTEETVLFPNALKLLTTEDWLQVKKGEEEIGWMNGLELNHTTRGNDETNAPKGNNTVNPYEQLHVSEGFISLEQLNLIFKTMPVDLTFVDENDKVAFYNRGEERIFPRSAGIIGREVKFCHPPKSVDTVLEILEKFKNGEKSEASFWIKHNNKLLYIRYFAVRDVQNNYKGVLEMSQDITTIKTIEGQKRLLDWQT